MTLSFTIISLFFIDTKRSYSTKQHMHVSMLQYSLLHKTQDNVMQSISQSVSWSVSWSVQLLVCYHLAYLSVSVYRPFVCLSACLSVRLSASARRSGTARTCPTSTFSPNLYTFLLTRAMYSSNSVLSGALYSKYLTSSVK